MAKTKPHTVRFEEKDFEFICKRESLKTAQGIVSFLMENYIKLWRVEKKSVFSVQEDVYTEHNKVGTLKEQIVFEQPISQLKRIKSAEQYVLEKREIECEEDYIKWLDELNNDDNLTSRQKQQIKST